jgi:hypothetical protein
VFGEQAQQGQPHDEAIGRRPETETESRLQSVALRLGQPLEAVEERHRELMDRRKRQLHLDSIPTARTTRHPLLPTATYSSSAVLPMPASPRSTNARLLPARVGR